jgi:hypothetical protein
MCLSQFSVWRGCARHPPLTFPTTRTPLILALGLGGVTVAMAFVLLLTQSRSAYQGSLNQSQGETRRVTGIGFLGGGRPVRLCDERTA